MPYNGCGQNTACKVTMDDLKSVPQGERLSESGSRRSRASPGENACAVDCQVCGARSAANFFGAVVCMPCKAFFIRATTPRTNKKREVTFQCSAKKECLITPDTRVACKYCRLQRCLAVGMCRTERPTTGELRSGSLRCAVCDALGNGLHFGVISCEGCKKFFRRISLEEKDKLECLTSGQCDINTKTRNKCRSCRYIKCVAVGMSRSAIKMGRPTQVKTRLPIPEDECPTQAKTRKVVQRETSPAGGIQKGESGAAKGVDDDISKVLPSLARSPESGNAEILHPIKDDNPSPRSPSGLLGSTPFPSPEYSDAGVAEAVGNGDDAPHGDEGHLEALTVRRHQDQHLERNRVPQDVTSQVGHENEATAPIIRATELPKSCVDVGVPTDGDTDPRRDVTAAVMADDTSAVTSCDDDPSFRLVPDPEVSPGGVASVGPRSNTRSIGHPVEIHTATIHSPRGILHEIDDNGTTETGASSMSDLLATSRLTSELLANANFMSDIMHSGSPLTLDLLPMSSFTWSPVQSSSSEGPATPRVTSHQPTASSVTSHQPTVSSVTSHQPTSSSMASHQPTVSSVTSHPPTSSSMTLHPPTSSSMTSHPPTSSSMTSHPSTTSSVTSHPSTTSSMTSHPSTTSSVTSHQPTTSSVTSQSRSVETQTKPDFIALLSLSMMEEIQSKIPESPDPTRMISGSDLCLEVEPMLMTVDHEYWAAMARGSQGELFTKQHHLVAARVVNAYRSYVDSLRQANIVTARKIRVEGATLGGGIGKVDVISPIFVDMVVRWTKACFPFCSALPGFGDLNMMDQFAAIKGGGPPSRLLVATVHFYDASTHTFSNSWYPTIPGPQRLDFPFYHSLLDLGKQLAPLNIDLIEGALLTAMIFMANDVTLFSDVHMVRRSQTQIFSALEAYTTAKYGSRSGRVQALFEKMPIVRAAGIVFDNLAHCTVLGPGCQHYTGEEFERNTLSTGHKE